MKHFIIGIMFFLSPLLIFAQKYIVSGTIRDASNGESLIGVAVYVTELKTGAVTNTYGFFSITLPKGTYNLTVSYLGFKTESRTLNLSQNEKWDINMVVSDKTLQEVKVTGERKNANVQKVEMSTAQIPIKTIQRIPALMGEVDVIKTIQLLPGVQTAGEGGSGFYVRGGNVDQNLVLLDEATVYNVSHLGGFFSVFNQDAIKDVKLYKGGIPAEYGGRLSSLLDIRMKEGNLKRFAVTGGIGILSSRLTVEAPILPDKCSFVISGRRTYYDLFFPLLPDTNIQKSAVYFYDLNAKINYTIDENNRVFFSGYFGNDIMSFAKQFEIQYGNATFTTRYNHLFSSKLFSNVTLIYSKFDYSLGQPSGPMSFKWISYIKDYSIKNDYTWYLNPKNTIHFGAGTIYHIFAPGYLTGESFFSMALPNNYAFEHSVFASNEQKIGDKLTLQYGLRFTAFQNFGKATYYVFDTKNPEQYTVIDTLEYESNELINTYYGLEPRFNLVYQINDETSIKASYNRTFQYIHLATNTMSLTPLDVWFPSTPNNKPQRADQVAIGLFKNFFDNILETSFEIYYKDMNDVVDFKNHSMLLTNPYFDGELRRGTGYSYGAEIFIKKREGRFTGWISYTYSVTKRKIPEVSPKEFFATYDKPHNLSLVASFDITNRINISANWVYVSGAPRTMPTGKFIFDNNICPIYTERNSIRLPDYHRMDLSLTIDGKKVKPDGTPKRFIGSWNFSIYNLYDRHNAYSIEFNQDSENPNITKAEKFYLFSIFPSITYNFKF